MTIRAAIYGHLSTDAGVAALIVGADGNPRLYPFRARPDSASPYVTFTQVGGAPDYVLRGRGCLVNPRYQFDVWGDKAADVDAVARAIKTAFDVFVGVTRDDVRVLAAQLVLEQDLNEPNTGLVRVSMDYELWFKELTP